VPPVDWTALLPVIAPVAALLLVLVVDAVAPAAMRQNGSRLRSVLDAVCLAGLLVAAGGVSWLARDGVGGTRGDVAMFCTTPASGTGGPEFVVPDCAYVASQLTLTLQAVVLAAAVVTLLLTLHGPGASDRVAHHVLFLTAVSGGLALAGARDLISLLVAVELSSLPAVALVALRRDARGAQGALAFLLTAIGSLGMLALGAGLLLLATGSLYLQRISLVLSVSAMPDGVRAVASLGVLLAVAGLGYKLSAVPFHLWTPDTYAGAPLPIAAFLSVVSKAAGLAAVVVLLGVGVAPMAEVWAPVVGGVAALTMTVGNVMALRQRIAVRLLAWSTVAQAGWVLLPLAAAGTRAQVAGGVASGTRQAVAASVGYLVAYAAASLATFAVVVVFARHVAAGEGHALEDYRGLARREPVAAAVLGFGLLCLAGLPPGVMGLVAKLVAVRPVVDAGAWLVAVVAAVNVALGVAYYLRWAALLVAAPSGAAVPTWRVRPAEGLALGAGAAACLAFSLFPDAVAAVLPGALG